MTTTVTETTQLSISNAPLDNLAAVLGIIVISLLMLLLVQKELFRARGGTQWSHIAQSLDTAIFPLVLTAGGVLFLRALDIVNMI